MSCSISFPILFLSLFFKAMPRLDMNKPDGMKSSDLRYHFFTFCRSCTEQHNMFSFWRKQNVADSDESDSDEEDAQAQQRERTTNIIKPIQISSTPQKPLNQSDKVFQIINKYLQNGQCSTHRFRMRLLSVRSVGLAKSFKDEILLWHGTQLDNITKILEVGFEKPKEGNQMFGSGIYFADRATKSAQYVLKPGETQVYGRAMILLCQVKLGKVYEARRAIPKMTNAPLGYDSVKGVGKYEPNETETQTLNGIKIPLGKTVRSLNINSDLRYNEYIIYHPERAKVAFILEFEFLQKSDQTTQEICTTCSFCNRNILGTTKSYIFNDNTSCEFCYFRKTNAHCMKCSREILYNQPGEVWNTLMDGPWHVACVFCFLCNKTLRDETTIFHSPENRLHICCEQCYDNNFLHKCSVCRKVIKANGKVLKGKHYHEQCLCCSKCQVNISGSLIFDKNDLLYCENCFCNIDPLFCTECSLLIQITKGKSTTMEGKHWHSDCFQCATCKRSLSGMSTYQTKNSKKLYCETCFCHLSSKICEKCRSLIMVTQDPGISLSNKNWHTSCFFCTSCKMSLQGKSVFENGNHTDLYCENCYCNINRLFCAECNLIIRITQDQGVNMEGKHWHTACFHCVKCRTSLSGLRTYQTPNSKKLYCETCFCHISQKICEKCKTLIMVTRDPGISMSLKNWHTSCFLCTSCATSLQGKGVFENGNYKELYCGTCYSRKFGKLVNNM